MGIDVYRLRDYKAYLNKRLDELDEGGRGSRARMSRAIACQTAYTAQVLRGVAHFNLEQGEAINDFLGHTEEQGHFFLLLIQFARAGMPKLKSRFQKQIESIVEGRQLLKNRLGVKEHLAEHDQLIYYSSWFYGALHALVSIPTYQTPERIAERLQIGIKQAAEALEFLLKSGLIERTQKGTLQIGKGQIHLGADSPLIAKHHINWRLQAIRAVERNPKAGLHYSSVVSISRKDEEHIRDTLTNFLQTIKPIIRESKEEEACSLSIDFFRI